MLWFLSRLAHWKLDSELTEKQEEAEPADLMEARDWRLPLDRTDLPDTRLEPEAAAQQRNAVKTSKEMENFKCHTLLFCSILRMNGTRKTLK